MQDIELQEVETKAGVGEPLVNRDLELLSDVNVELTVQVGSTQITASELFALKQGQVVKLNEFVDEPVKLLLGDKAVANGKLVVSDDCFAIEITELK